MGKFLIVVVALNMVAACHDPSAPSPPPQPIMITGGGQSDTVDAALSTPVRVAVRDSMGRPLSRVLVYLQSIGEDDVRVLFGRTPTGPWRDWTEEQYTDGNGAVISYVRLGGRAGIAYVKAGVIVGDVSYADTLTFEIRPGAPVDITVLPKDTTLYVGASYQFAVRVADRLGNARPDVAPTATYRLLGSALSITGSARVTAQYEGRAGVEVSANSHLDTAYVSIVPRGTIAMASLDVDSLGVYQMNLDGSQYRLISTIRNTNLAPRWNPTGEYLMVNGPARVELDGTFTHLPGAPAQAGAVMNAWIAFSPDGKTLYFEGGNGLFTVIWRMPVAGGDAQKVTGFECRAPTMSPDGARLACAHHTAAGDRITLLNLASGDTVSIAGGFAPRWSPDGQWLAFYGRGSGVADYLMAIRPDGTGLRIVAAGAFWGGIDWSPDSRYLLAAGGYQERLYLVRFADGLLMPLCGLTRRFHQASWRA